MNTAPKCPSPFVSVDATTCVMPCPSEKGFVRRQVDGPLKCVYSADPTYMVDLVTVAPVAFSGSTLDDLFRQGGRMSTSQFDSEKSRFERDFAVLNANMDKSVKVEGAFRALQLAENARDEAPDAYQMARTAYYTLIKGQDWINEERARIAKTEVGPEIEKYNQAVAGIRTQKDMQQKTMDVVQGVKDKVFSLRDDFKYSVDILNNQVEKLKIQINMENRSREKTPEPFWDWLDTILNIVLFAVLAYTAWVLYKTYSARPAPSYTVKL